MDRLVAESVTLANTTGFLMSKNGDAELKHVPFTVMPSPVKSVEFYRALKLCNLFNKLTVDVAADYAFLRETLAETAEGDKKFTGRLLALLDGARPAHSGIEFSINRYDYFVNASHWPEAPDSSRGLRMTEMNCIAAGGLAQAGLISKVHKMVVTHPAAAAAGVKVDPRSLPENNVLANSAFSCVLAHQEFCKMYAKKNWPSVRMVMVVIPPYCNACDQDMLRWRIWEQYKIDFLRLTLAEINDHGTIGDDGALFISNCKGISSFVVSVAYFRTGYAPYEYPTEKEWSGRALLERSNAVSCPSVAMQLVGTKKMQQVLDVPGVVEAFCPDEDDAALIRSCFVRQYDLEPGDAGDVAVKMALENPGAFVLKPQREGGGNNLYKEEMKELLLELSPEKRAAFTLMQRIHPASVKNIIVRDGKWEEGDLVCEIGIYGSIIRVKGEEVQNDVVGTSMKSKLRTLDDGGIGAGIAVYDSPRLI